MQVVSFVALGVSDSLFCEPAREVISALGKDGVEPIRGLGFLLPATKLQSGYPSQGNVQIAAVLDVLFENEINVVQLHQSNCSVQVVHMVLITNLLNIHLRSGCLPIYSEPTDAAPLR